VDRTATERPSLSRRGDPDHVQGLASVWQGQLEFGRKGGRLAQVGFQTMRSLLTGVSGLLVARPVASRV
jgi:hypothetical protein